MLVLRNISFTHPNKDLLFENLHLAINSQDKIAVIGNNGTGKSTMLRIIAGELQPSGGQIELGAKPFYLPQIFGQFNSLTVGQALGIEDKLTALGEILEGHATTENFTILDDDWTLEERCNIAMQHWELRDVELNQKIGSQSGGQKTKVFLAGISVHESI